MDFISFAVLREGRYVNPERKNSFREASTGAGRLMVSLVRRVCKLQLLPPLDRC